ncbi:MAG: NAD(P)/FAD-dependent oxidoreductase [Planctomycetota bacterium]
MAKLAEIYDVVIIGATPAGASAALRARQIGLSCLVIEAAPADRQTGWLDWMGPAACELCHACGLDATALRATAYQGLRLHSWDFKRNTRVSDAELAGWIVDQPTLCRALLDVARQAGSQTLFDAQPVDLTLGEDYTDLLLRDGRQVRARVLIIADGLDSPVANLARVPTARDSEGLAQLLGLSFNNTTQETGLEVIIGARRNPQAATLIRTDQQGYLKLVTSETTTSALEQFSELLAGAQAVGLVPAEAGGTPHTAPCPAGLALDMDTLVGKRCLLTGEAAGFITAFSSEAIYPSMISGRVAAEAVARALQAPVPQDELLSFSVAWRAELADYMRLPNTDLSLLMPLIFNNPQMSGRVARAFLRGQSF